MSVAFVRLWLIAALLLGLGQLAGQARAESAALEDYRVRVDQTQRILERLERTLTSGGSRRSADLLAARDRIRDLREADIDLQETFAKQRDALRADLERLGAAPAKDARPEPEEIAAERRRIANELNELEAVLRKDALNDSLAGRLLDGIAEARREAFYDRLLQSDPSPFEPAVIGNAMSEAGTLLERGVAFVSEQIADWQAREDRDQRLLSLIGAFLLAFVVMFPVRRVLVRLVVRKMEALVPTPARIVIAAFAMTLARLLPWLVGTGIIVIAVRHAGVVPEGGGPLAMTVWLWLMVIVGVNAAATAIFLVEVPGWQLVTGELGRRLAVRGLMLASAAVLAADAVFKMLATPLQAAPELALVQSAITSVLLAVLMFALTRRGIWLSAEAEAAADDERAAEAAPAGEPGEATEEQGGGVNFLSWRSLRVLAAIVAVTIIIATAIGQVSFGYFLATRAFYLAGLTAAAWSVRSLIQEALSSAETSMARNRRRYGDSGARLTFYFGLAADVLLLMLVLPPSLVILGADSSDVSNFVRDAFYGVQIGSVRLSVADILSAIGVFLVVLAVTWLVQRVFDRRMFPHMRVDIGVRHSFRKLIGYVGVMVAVIGAVGALGFNLSSVAIVAGALSVGIGFGLQSIVNNFVSGLILLFERPIKIGDWIVTSAGEGYVRRISVRSTEIETFERSSIIVPNSELIGSAVTNRTHGNNIGRVSVAISVAFDEDPRRVIGILREIVRDNTDVMRYPEPIIYFAGFGASSLDFEIRAYLRDINLGLDVRTDLRLAIFERFAAEGLRIPYPHRTVQVVSATPAPTDPDLPGAVS